MTIATRLRSVPDDENRLARHVRQRHGRELPEAAQAFVALLEYTSSTSNRLIAAPLFIPTPTNQRFQLHLAQANDGKLKFVGVARPQKPIMMTVTPP